MKYLTNYIEEAQTKAFDKAGSFFAFSKMQFDEAKKEGVTYVSMGNGLICPKDNSEELVKELIKIGEEGIAQDLKENGKEAIIHRELANHEYCITYDITDTFYALDGYGITKEEIRAEAPKYLQKHYEWEADQEKRA